MWWSTGVKWLVVTSAVALYQVQERTTESSNTKLSTPTQSRKTDSVFSLVYLKFEINSAVITQSQHARNFSRNLTSQNSHQFLKYRSRVAHFLHWLSTREQALCLCMKQICGNGHLLSVWFPAGLYHSVVWCFSRHDSSTGEPYERLYSRYIFDTVRCLSLTKWSMNQWQESWQANRGKPNGYPRLRLPKWLPQ